MKSTGAKVHTFSCRKLVIWKIPIKSLLVYCGDYVFFGKKFDLVEKVLFRNNREHLISHAMAYEAS